MVREGGRGTEEAVRVMGATVLHIVIHVSHLEDLAKERSQRKYKAVLVIGI